MSTCSGYLLDTNILSYWINERSEFHERVAGRIASVPEDVPLFMSAITWGEIQFGWHRRHKEPIPAANLRVFEQTFQTVPVTRGTDLYYGQLKARLFERFAPRSVKTKSLSLGLLLDPVAGDLLGVDENDVWIAAQAVESKLILVTNDKLTRIRDSAGDLDLQIDNWAAG
ncbi:MAG: type II toxin-antitoxin system VapC family toxin [FCB group bacterium]|jgi:tRNA(fMet)-specific endonuclease VapC|nr:type II toxin-antitoxin system VapC family toxin [FCB group bacterium]